MRKFNWPLWAGFLLTLISFLSYPFVFVRFPVTRDFPWANLLLFALAAALLLIGVRRAFAVERTHPRRSRIAGAILTTFSFAIFGLFVFGFFIFARHLPASHGAPKWASRRRPSLSPTLVASQYRFPSYSPRQSMEKLGPQAPSPAMRRKRLQLPRVCF